MKQDTILCSASKTIRANLLLCSLIMQHPKHSHNISLLKYKLGGIKSRLRNIRHVTQILSVATTW